MNPSIRFAHIRDIFPIGLRTYATAATIAFRDGAIPGTVDYAVALCSERDQFCKAKGREIATKRLENLALARKRENLAAKVGTIAVPSTDYRTVVDTILNENALLNNIVDWL